MKYFRCYCLWEKFGHHNFFQTHANKIRAYHDKPKLTNVEKKQACIHFTYAQYCVMMLWCEGMPSSNFSQQIDPLIAASPANWLATLDTGHAWFHIQSHSTVPKRSHLCLKTTQHARSHPQDLLVVVMLWPSSCLLFSFFSLFHAFMRTLFFGLAMRLAMTSFWWGCSIFLHQH